MRSPLTTYDARPMAVAILLHVPRSGEERLDRPPAIERDGAARGVGTTCVASPRKFTKVTTSAAESPKCSAKASGSAFRSNPGASSKTNSKG